ncbi:MAG: hypothetical protein C4344_06205, partial [Acidimicrobiia bacterium]
MPVSDLLRPEPQLSWRQRLDSLGRLASERPMVLAATVAVLAAAAGLAWFLLSVPSTDPRAGSARRGDPVL